MSQDKLFIIAIGGTGMRCLESFVHMCAIGMFDNHEIDILTLDTDQSNGNKKRVEDLVDHYIRIKSSPGAPGGKPASNTFFSAKLRLTKYWTDYSPGRDNFQVLSKYHGAGDENADLARLFFDDEVQEFNLSHGYRAQTHLGSYLMYHAIIESALNVKHDGEKAKDHEKSFMEYIERIFSAGDNARVFIFGSIFGGTGASSLPVIPVALKDAMKIYKNNNSEISAKFAASLLTEYFSFPSPNDAQKSEKRDKVIADSTYFTLNSQAALMFYQNDPTVRNTYKSLYLIGWPVGRADFGNGSVKTLTGGPEQTNPCHVTELLCAFAAYHFFNRTDAFGEKEAEYLFRTAKFENNSFDFEFKDFCESDNVLKNRLAGFYSVALFTLIFQGGIDLGKEGITGWLKRLQAMKFTNFENKIEQQDKVDINDYFKCFLFSRNKDAEFVAGWLYQVRNSVQGKFLLPGESFPTDYQAVIRINPGTILPDEKSKWGLNKKGRPNDVGESFDDFVTEFIKPSNQPKQEQNVGGVAKMELLAQLYNTITELQNL